MKHTKLIGLAVACLAGCTCSRSPSGGGSGGAGGASNQLGCIDDWPVAGTESLDEPLTIAPEIMWRRPLSNRSPGLARIVATADSVAVSGPNGDGLDIVHLSDRSLASFRAPSLWPASSSAVADEKRGRFVFSDTHATFSVGMNGKLAWEHRFGAKVGTSEYAGGTEALIDPLGAIYVAGADEYLYKLDGDTGTEVWKAKIGLCSNGLVACSLRFGAGNAVFVDAPGAPIYHRETGVLLGGLQDPQAPGKYLGAGCPGRESGLIAARASDASRDIIDIVGLDICIKPRWRMSAADYPTALIRAHHDDIIVRKELALAGASTPHKDGIERYSKDGEKLFAVEFTGIDNRISTGSDGTLYVLLCGTTSPGSIDEGLELVALRPNLTEKWRMPFPDSSCSASSLGTLGPDGIYYLARGTARTTLEMELIAIRTTSPTTAKTSWPDTFGTSTGARWLLPAP